MDIGGRSGEMEVFTMVAEHGSLSGAARALGLTPSAISRIITRTEQRIGTRLLLRTTRAITFTAEGEAYLRGARRILADMAEVEDAITDQGAPRGRLRVSAALAHGRMTIVPLIAAFSARYPAIVVDLMLGDEVVDILGGQADVAIRFGTLADSPLTARLIGSTGQVIVASPEYLARHGTPVTPQDLLQHNCLRFNFRRAAPDWPPPITAVPTGRCARPWPPPRWRGGSATAWPRPCGSGWSCRTPNWSVPGPRRWRCRRMRPWPRGWSGRRRT